MSELRTAPFLDDLEQQRALFDQFLATEQARLNSIRANAENINAAAKGDIGALKETKAELEQRLAETKKQLGTKKTEVDAVLSEVANLRKTATVEVPAKLAEKSKALEDEQRALEVARRDYEAKRVGRELRKNEMSKGVTFYKERLGLAFEKLPDCSLSFRLTLIDPENPQRPFSFAMFVDQSNVYHVLRCEPRVEFDPLLAQLNRDNKLSVFVQHMRRLFKKLV